MNTTAVAVAGLIAAATAQQPSSAPGAASAPVREPRVFSVSVSLVQLDVVVTDTHGRAITDLKEGDFEVLQDGRLREVAHVLHVSTSGPPAASTATTELSTSAPPPRRERRTLVFVVDDLSLSFFSTAAVRRALKRFLDTQMQPDDQVAIVRTASGIGAMQQLTSDKRLLLEAAKRLHWNVRFFLPSMGGLSFPAPFAGTVPGSGDFFHDVDSAEEEMGRRSFLATATVGTIRFIVDGLAGLPGRKTLVLFSGGVLGRLGDPSLKKAVTGLLEQANRASVVIYAVDSSEVRGSGISAEDASAKEVGVPQWPAPGDDILGHLARQTGGLLVNQPEHGLRRVLADHEGYYLLGFIPDASTFQRYQGNPAYHRLEVRVRRPGLRVRSRAGFYGVPDLALPPKRALTGAEQLRAAITSPFAPVDMGVRLLSVFRNDPGKGPLVHSLLHVDGPDLTLHDEQDGSRRGALEQVAILFDGNGVPVDHKAWSLVLKQSPVGMEELLTRGLDCALDLAVKQPGSYQVRVAVRDTPSGRVASASQFVEVPDLKKGRLVLSGVVMRGGAGDATGEPATAEAAVPPGGGIGEEGLPLSTSTPGGATPSVRRLRAGMALDYAFDVYNARGQGTGGPRLERRVRLLHNGHESYVGLPTPLSPAAESWKRVAIQGRINLGRTLEAGDYVLEVLVRDTVGRRRTASQTVDFEIVDGH